MGERALTSLATEAVDISVDGYAGKQFAILQPPDYTQDDCRGAVRSLGERPAIRATTP